MTESVLDYMTRLGRAARDASRVIGRASTAQKNRALLATAAALDAARTELSAANELDLAAGRANGLEPAMLERLTLTPARIDKMIEGLRQVANLADPIGAIRDMSFVPSGIQVGKMRVPLGVVGIIYESRPNVTIDAASLCLKSGNATILRGGSEAIHSNRAIATCVQSGLAEAGLPPLWCKWSRPLTVPRWRPDHHARVCGRHRSTWRQGPDLACQSRCPGAGHQAPGRYLPRLRQCPRRPAQGTAYCVQRQDLPLRYLRRDGNLAGRSGHCR